MIVYTFSKLPSSLWTTEVLLMQEEVFHQLYHCSNELTFKQNKLEKLTGQTAMY